MRNRTGAIGGLLAATLAHAGERMSVITRDAHLASIVEIGLCFIEGG
jgi:ketopantoate reductase